MQRFNRKKEKEREKWHFQKISKHSESKSLSQAELVEMTDVSQPMIAQYEKGKKVPSIFVGVDLSRVLNTTVEELVNGKESVKHEHR